MKRPTKRQDCGHPRSRVLTTGSKRLIDVARWQCKNCGQQVFAALGAEPPEICQYCNDMTTWQFIER